MSTPIVEIVEAVGVAGDGSDGAVGAAMPVLVEGKDLSRRGVVDCGVGWRCRRHVGAGQVYDE